MELTVIKSNDQYQQYLDWIDKMFDAQVALDTTFGKQVQVALLLIKDYKDRNFPIPLPDPIDAVKLKMDEMRLKNKDLIGIVASKSYFSMILNRRKPLTLDLARLFHKELKIPAEILLS